MKMTELSRMFKCFTTKSYHALQDDYSRISLISPTDSSAVESNLESQTSSTNAGVEEESNESNNSKSDKLRVRPHSAGDISESLRLDHSDIVIVQGSLTPTESHRRHHNNVPVCGSHPTNNNNSNSGGNTSSSGGGGFLSFLGSRFNKSGTRHLDRSSGGERSDLDKPGKLIEGDNRYTKFPLTSPSQRSCVPTDSPFDETHIQLTPQTKTYALPYKSPVPPVKGIIHGANPNKFLANAVSSLGRRSKDSSAGSSNKQHNKSRSSNNQESSKHLTIKSKSDNSLNKVTLGGNQSSRSGGPRNLLSPDCYPLPVSDISAGSAEKRLNSVQTGDHATIRLPWTGFQPQQLNSSAITPTRLTSHHSSADPDSVRYVECRPGRSSNKLGSNAGRGTSSTNQEDCWSHIEVIYLPRRRARSLERSSNFRIFPVSSPSVSSKSNNNNSPSNNNNSNNIRSPTGNVVSSISPQRPTKLHVRDNNSSVVTAGRSPSFYEQSLSPTQRRIRLRNLASFHLVDLPPVLPKKKTKPPPLGKLHRSAPNSSLSSVESSSSDSASVCSASAPPSPPPRPASTLRPESRPIISTSASSASSSPSSGIHQASQRSTRTSSNTRTGRSRESHSNSNSSSKQRDASDSNNCTTASSSSSTMNANRRPAVPRSVATPAELPHHSQRHELDQSTGGSSTSMALEDARASGFINKPSKGWLHSDQIVSKEGVTYTVRYIGCLDVNTSMKSLDFETRSLIAKECINQVCEAAGLKSVDKKRKTDRRVARILGLRPRLDQAGSDAHLTITSTCLKLTSLDTGDVIASHDLPNISFASGGDATMLDFVAYVAKDSIVGRACFVLECGSGRAQDVITTIGQAFELRFKEYLQKRPMPPPRLPDEDPDREYYNDLPGKVPPELPLGSSASTILLGASGSSTVTTANCGGTDVKDGKSRGIGRNRAGPGLTLPTCGTTDNKDLISVNLIDFEAPTPPAFGPSNHDRNLEALLLNDTAGAGSSAPTLGNFGDGRSVVQTGSGSGLASPIGQSKNPFNMHPLGNSLPPAGTGRLSPAEQKAQLEAEPWFHGLITRSEAEVLVRNDGDFLVRESQTKGQYVLTGLQDGSAKHLLLVDPEGIVRTKDREFDSVIHLIKYHSDNCLPIISAESMVLLRNPVMRPNHVISSSTASPASTSATAATS